MITRYKVTSENKQDKTDGNTAVIGYYATEIAAHNSAIQVMKNFGYGATGAGQWIANEYSEENFTVDGIVQTATYAIALIDRQLHNRLVLGAVHILKITQKKVS